MKPWTTQHNKPHTGKMLGKKFYWTSRACFALVGLPRFLFWPNLIFLASSGTSFSEYLYIRRFRYSGQLIKNTNKMQKSFRFRYTVHVLARVKSLQVRRKTSLRVSNMIRMSICGAVYGNTLVFTVLEHIEPSRHSFTLYLAAIQR